MPQFMSEYMLDIHLATLWFSYNPIKKSIRISTFKDSTSAPRGGATIESKYILGLALVLDKLLYLDTGELSQGEVMLILQGTAGAF